MKYFKKYFEDVEENDWCAEEVKVLCPFHQDTRPSASINTSKNLFHCWVCNIGYNEEQFVAKINNISTAEATKLLDKYNIQNEWNTNEGLLWSDSNFLDKVKALGLSEDTIKELRLGVVRQENTNRKLLGIPVFYNGILVDVRKYNLLKYDGVPKCSSNENAESGWIIPYDNFLNSDEVCYIFEGEKDMLCARDLGINAYTMTSGAGATPNTNTIGAFKGKDIVLCYDNDDAGMNGMLGMFKSINSVVNSVKYVKIGDLVSENKEDFYDYINKYDGYVFEFYALDQHQFALEDIEKDKRITIKEALNGNKLRRDLKSVVTVTSEFSDPYSVPTIVDFYKYDEKGSKNETMFEGEERHWYLDKSNMVQMLELIEASAKDVEIKGKLKSYVGIPNTEPFIEMHLKELKTVYKSTVVDKDIDGAVQSLDLYSFDRLDVGGQYVIEYSIFPHPTKHQKLVAICYKSILVHDTRNFNIDKNKLSVFRKDGSIEERLDYLYQSAKHHIAKHLNYDIWLMSDLVFNSILDFNYGGPMRGCLDVFFLGDTQVGKSETTGELVKLYNFGHFLSLKTSTTVGLIGGSSKIDGAFCNTIGAIPRQHKRLAILEEFSGAKHDFIKTMTDIRSSNELRLSRVSGELVVPCKLRMITISNPRNDENGNPRFLNTFPNGIMPLMELIKSAEDVARYDGFLLIPKVSKRFNPFEFNLVGKPIPKDAYRNKINWVATRGAENVKFDEGVESYIWEKAEEMNDIFECNFPLFGTTTSKKLARFCVALSTLLVNVDESYENIIVTKDIVDYMVGYLIKLYTGGVFKLDTYAREYREYSECTEADIRELQALYAKNATLFNFLNGQSKTTRSNLASVSGLDSGKFFPIFNKLVANKFIRLSMENVYPTDKFRIAYNNIDKGFTADTGSLINSSGISFGEPGGDISELN
jgi:hypothetical protein